ncbi:MAG: hypothetical protein EOP47_20305 [Sphingobacteriaceae bacterium]|nr:MAG: hypothetical protein EOP47_20305 [Sphingobacteriaceae bacterium]
MEKYSTLGFAFVKHNQLIGLIFSTLLIIAACFIGAPIYFWFVYISGIVAINRIWYCFCDIKWNKESFVIEKFLYKKEIPSEKFVSIERSVFWLTINFTDCKFYFFDDLGSFFKNTEDITNSIKQTLIRE